MYPWLRLIRAGFSVLNQPDVPLLATTSVKLRIWPNDLDFNFHLNNGRYLSLADIGRLHWFWRTGILRAAMRLKTFPVLSGTLTRFRRDLKLLQSVEIHTRILGWDSKWGFIEHRFVRGGRVMGLVAVRGAFKGPEGILQPSRILESGGYSEASPPLPDWIVNFARSSDLLSETLREEERTQGHR
jgi:acyl-CoA thioesterase FadM